MATPLTTLRRYQYAFFVFFGILLMVVFVVGDPLYSWLGNRQGGGGGRQQDVTVVTWRGDSMTESQLYNERVIRNIVQEFISAVVTATQAKNGVPQAQRLMLAPNEREIVYTKVLATRAEQMGLEVTDEAVLQYLEKLSADLLPRSEIGRIFKETIGNRISEQQALNTIKTELAAQNYITLTYPDLTRGHLPAQAWEYFRRLNRRVKTEIAPVNVADFKAKLGKEPTQSEVQALYDAGKERYPEPGLPDPGFKRRRKIAFDFVKADHKKFEDEEFAKLRPQVTDQEITEYYEKNKEDFIKKPDAPAKPENTVPPAAPTAEKPADPAKPEGTDAKPAEPTAPAPEKKPETPAEPAKPEGADAKPPESTTPAPEKKPETPAEPASDKKGDETPAKPADQPASSESKTGEPKAEAPQTDDAKPDSSCQDEGAKEQDKADEKPADAPQPETAPPAADAAKPAEEKGAEAPKETPAAPAEAPAAAPTDKPAEKPATSDVPAAPEKPKADAAPPAKPAVTYRPLDDKLREEIRDLVGRQKASKAAQDRVEAGFNEIERAVNKYAQQKRTAELKKNAVPAQPDLAKIASQHGMEFGQVPLSDPIEVQKFEIGKTSRFEISVFQQLPFDAIAYRENVPLLKPERISGSETNVNFIYWKTEQQEPFVPELKDIHAEVVDAWKQREALTLAQAHAKSLADQARAAAGSLADTIGKQEGVKVSETNQFSWLTSGSMPMGMGSMPGLSTVDGVDYAGQEFMQSVMSLKSGEIGTAVNQPHTTVYVVRIVSESPPDEALREMFLVTGTSMELMQVARMEREDMRRNWIEQIERDMSVTWVRQPNS